MPVAYISRTYTCTRILVVIVISNLTAQQTRIAASPNQGRQSRLPCPPLHLSIHLASSVPSPPHSAPPTAWTDQPRAIHSMNSADQSGVGILGKVSAKSARTGTDCAKATSHHGGVSGDCFATPSSTAPPMMMHLAVPRFGRTRPKVAPSAFYRDECSEPTASRECEA